MVTNSAKISLALQEEFETLLDIALGEKVANMKDLGTKFVEAQEGGKKSIQRLAMCEQLAEDIKTLKAASA